MKRIIISQDTFEKMKVLKKLASIKKNTSYIEKLVNDVYMRQKEIEKYKKSLNNSFYWVGAADLINIDKIIK